MSQYCKLCNLELKIFSTKILNDSAIFLSIFFLCENFQISNCSLLYTFQFSFSLFPHLSLNISSLTTTGPFGGSCQIHGPISMESEEVTMSMSTLDVDPQPPTVTQQDRVKSPIMKNPGYSHLHCPTELHRSCFCVRFIAEHTRMLEDSIKGEKCFPFFSALKI